jgi:hypothetical protein
MEETCSKSSGVDRRDQWTTETARAGAVRQLPLDRTPHPLERDRGHARRIGLSLAVVGHRTAAIAVSGAVAIACATGPVREHDVPCVDDIGAEVLGIGAADRNHRRTDRNCDVHRTRVVADEEIGVCDLSCGRRHRST